MTNQKNTNGEKILGEIVGCVVGSIGMITALYFWDSSLKIHPRNYPTLIQEEAIVREQKNFKQHQLKTSDSEVLEKYAVFTDLYDKNLESKLAEIKASPQYVVEQEASKKDSKTRDNYLWNSLLFASLGLGSLLYVTRKVHKREKSLPPAVLQ